MEHDQRQDIQGERPQGSAPPPAGAGHAGECVRVYVNEGDTYHGQPLAEAIVRRLRDLGCAGATVVRGWAGYGSHGEVHAARMVDVMPPLPLIVEWVDTPDHTEYVLPRILAMVGEGLVVRFPVQIVQFTHRALAPLPARVPVSAVMSHPVQAVATTTPVRDLVAGLLDRAQRTVLVTDEQGRLAGIITNGDLVERARLSARVHLLAALGPEAVRREVAALADSPLTAADVMTRAVVTATPEMSVRAAAALMDARRLKRLPVVDRTGRPAGMVSRVDLLRTIAHGAPPGSRPEGRTRGGAAGRTGVRSHPGRHAGADLGLVGDLVISPVPTVTPDAPLSAVLDAVISTRLSRAVVVDTEGRPLGTISDAELLQRVDPAVRAGVLTAIMRRLPFHRDAPVDEAAQRAAAATRAADLMAPDLPLVTADTPLAEAIEGMLSTRRKILPVVDGEGRLLGMVDRADLLRAVAADGESASPAHAREEAGGRQDAGGLDEDRGGR